MGRRVMVCVSEMWDLAIFLQLFDDPQSHKRHDTLSVGGVFPYFHSVLTAVIV